MGPCPTRTTISTCRFAEKWSKGTPKKVDSAFIDKVVSSLKEVEYDTKKMSILEYSGYLEKYLWPLFDSDKATVMMMMIFHKVRAVVCIVLRTRMCSLSS